MSIVLHIRQIWWRMIIFVLIMAAISAKVYGYSAAEEYEIKAAFLYNLGNYLKFPTSVLSESDPDQNFFICILGRDPFQQNIDSAAEDEKIQGHPVKIKRLQRIQEVDGCHLLFISDSERSRLKMLFQTLARRPILTVGDTDDFIEQGGMLKFYNDNNKIRLALDLEKVRAVDIKPSANLLKIVKLYGNTQF